MPLLPRFRRLLAPVLAVSMLLSAAAILSACNTVAGAGADVSSIGNGVSSGATAVKRSVQ